MSQTVTPSECIAYAKFLAALADLRQTISQTDGLFGIHNFEAERFHGDEKNKALDCIREKRWAVYVTRAVHRYTVWWTETTPTSAKATVDFVEHMYYEKSAFNVEEVKLSSEDLPPLDVLMVWHAHHLSPRKYLEDCIRYGKIGIWKGGFPLNAIDRCIDDSAKYTTPSQMKQLFERLNLKDPNSTEVDCPRCGTANNVPWTQASFGETVAEAFKLSKGYADNSFEARCINLCPKPITHDRLKLAKLRKDVEQTMSRNHPMPGSFLNNQGIPQGYEPPASDGDKHSKSQDMLVSTYLVKEFHGDLMQFTDPKSDCENITQLWGKFDHIIHIIGQKKPTRKQKNHFRRLMSRYLDNPGPFALDLVGAVIQQGVFVESMKKVDWVHSPDVFGIMERLIQLYQVIFDIMLKYSSHTVVPTLDVDVAWHTHQLSPSRYYEYSTREAQDGKRVFLDHNDQAGEENIFQSFPWTSVMMHCHKTGKLYSECDCGTCGLIHKVSWLKNHLHLRLHRHKEIASHSRQTAQISAPIDVQPESGENPAPERSIKKSLSHAKPKDMKRLLRAAKTAVKVGVKVAKAVHKHKEEHGIDSNSKGERCPWMAEPNINSHLFASNPGSVAFGTGALGAHDEDYFYLRLRSSHNDFDSSDDSSDDSDGDFDGDSGDNSDDSSGFDAAGGALLEGVFDGGDLFGGDSSGGGSFD